jgi:hypothetical protein
MVEPSAYPGAPRWVKITTIITGILVLVFAALLHGGAGRHGPGVHGLHGGELPSVDAGGER